MKSFILFWGFAQASVSEILSEKNKYLSAFFTLVFLDNLETICLLSGLGEESNVFIGVSVLATVLSFIVLSQVVLIQKRKRGGDGELKYFVPTFLLYNLYYSFTFLIGLLLLIIPGFYFLFYFSMAPLVAVLDDTSEGEFFKKSRHLVKKNLPLVVWTSILNLMVDIAALLIIPIQEPSLKIVGKFVFSIPDAFFTVVMMVVTVKVYYFLRDFKESEIG